MKSDLLYKTLFRQALLIRLVEEKIVELYPSDKIQSPVHLSIGQEAVAVGLCHALRTQDLLFGTYRSHAFYIAKGGDLKQMMAELYGKVTGCGRGKAGSMHLAAPEVGFMGSSAVVASTLPHAVGAAWAAKLLGRDQVIVAVFGDGATDEGVYHECLNFVGLHRIPMLLVCENNGLAVHSSIQDRHSFSILKHAETYGIAAEVMDDGYDFVKIAIEMKKLAEKVVSDRLPQFVEVLTFRYKEHVGTGDDFHAGYRSTEAFEDWKKKDPLCWDSETRTELLPGVMAEIEEAVAFAEQSPWPEREELLAHVL